MSDLPTDVLGEILKRVPAQSLVCLNSVCKSWYGLINHERFIKSHLEHWRSLRSIITMPIREIKCDYGTTPRVSFLSVSFLNDRHLSYRFSEVLLDDYLIEFFSFLRVLNSCDGLLLLSVQGECFKDGSLRLLVCNLVTKSWSLLVPPSCSSELGLVNWRIVGDGSLQPYTIVGIQLCHMKETSDRTFTCLYFDLHQRESTGYKTVSVSIPWNRYFIVRPNVLSIGRKLHWMIYSFDEHRENGKELLLSLDFATNTLDLANIIRPSDMKSDPFTHFVSSDRAICCGVLIPPSWDYEIWVVEDFEQPIWRKRHMIRNYPAKFCPISRLWHEIYVEEEGKYIVIFSDLDEVGFTYDFISKEWTRIVPESNPSRVPVSMNEFSRHVNSLIR